MNILAIETSCDDTSVAWLEIGDSQIRIRANEVTSQIDKHQQFGGVVPEVASRYHLLNIIPTLKQAVDKVSLSLNKLDIIGVTVGPGLASSLLVGIDTAKGLGLALRKPVVGVNHIEGHILAGLLDLKNIESVSDRFPALCLTASGGHTWLIKIQARREYELIGQTLDDAAGEAFDKVARWLGLPYPGGPAISRLAESGDPCAVLFPRSMLNKSGFDFSFSGLKTAVRKVIDAGDVNQADIAASFQEAITDILVKRTLQASKALAINNLVVTGGVSLNRRLRNKFTQAAGHRKIFWPEPDMSTDNAAMIGLATYFAYQDNRGLELKPQPKLNLS